MCDTRAREPRPLPPAESLAQAVIALAAAARQATSDDAGTAFVAEHLLRTLNAVQALENELARLRLAVGEAATITEPDAQT